MGVAVGVRTRESITSQRPLVACGLVAALVYIATDVVAATLDAGYRYTAQAVSELSAIGSPTRSLVTPLFVVHGVLQLGFGIGVRRSSGHPRLRVAGGLLIGIGLVDLLGPLFPMHMRGAAPTLSDTMHIALTAVTVLLILLAIGFAAAALSVTFRLYSMATLVLLVAGGTLASMDGARLAANLPTPWLGVTERVNIYGYMLWMAVLAVTMLRTRQSAPAIRGEAASAPRLL